MKGFIFIKKKFIDADILYELYIVQELSQRQVAKELGISQTQVRREMEKANIPARDANSSRKCKGSQQRTKELAQRYSEEYKIWRTNVCAYCGKEFIVDGSHKKKKYCSDECIKAAFNERATVYYCKLCGNPIIQNGIKYKRIYCDNCLDKWRSIVFQRKLLQIVDIVEKKLKLFLLDIKIINIVIATLIAWLNIMQKFILVKIAQLGKVVKLIIIQVDFTVQGSK